MADARVPSGHAEHLVIAAVLIAHPVHADGSAEDHAAGERGLLQQHEGVQRITVVGERSLDEAVVGRVPGRREQHAIQPDAAGLVIHLVLVPLSLRYLDYDVKFHDGTPGVPRLLLNDWLWCRAARSCSLA